MVTIKQDSELITNYVAANPVPAGQRFEIFRDAQGDPGVFALSEDSYLYLIMVINGTTTKLDFGHTSGIVAEGVKVQAFAVVQAPDSTLDICIATAGSDDTSDFVLLHNVVLGELQGPIPSSKITRGSNFPTVHHIFMTNKSTEKERTLPLAMVAFKRPDRIVDTEDLRFVQFNSSATLLEKWELATNPKKILDVALGTCSLGHGAFILYQAFTGVVHVQFKFFTGSTMVVEPHCPEGATCIGVYVDPDSHQSVLLIGGKDVTAFKAKDYCSPKGTGTPIETGDSINSIKDLHVSQSGETLRFWYTTDVDAIHYYTTSTTTLVGGKVIPLLPEGQGGRISSMLSLNSADTNNPNPALVSSILSVDENGNLTLLQQDSASQLWQTYPFWHASSENVIELKGYMLRMHAVASDNGDESSLTPGCYLRVSSSGVVRCIVNGRHATLSPTPKWYQTDAKGVLNIMFQNDDDATCHQFAADAFRPAKPGSPETVLGDNPLLDPSRKLVKKLDGVTTPEDVRALRKPDGTPLVSPDASSEDLKAAADSISVLVEQAHKYHEGSQQHFVSFTTTSLESGIRAESTFSLRYSWGDFIDDVEGAWHWVEEKLKDAWKWGCEFIEDAAGRVWKFIIHIGEEVFQLALNTVSAIVKAITWVFKKLGALIEEIIQFFGYLFQWGDILDTSDSIAAGFNAALDYGEELLDKTELKVDSWLEDLRTNIKAQLPALQNNNYDGTKDSAPQSAEEKSHHQVAEEASDEDEVKSGVAYNWSTYYFTYGGGTTNAFLHDDDSQVSSLAKDSPDQIILQLWDDVQKEVETIIKLGKNIGKDFFGFFISGKYDIQSLMGKISEDLVDSLINSLKNLADILFQALSLGISLARDVATKTIDIPVLSWLWKNVIARGRPLSLLNVCCLLLAIPTTVLYKFKKKVAPPKLNNRLTKDTFGKYVSGTAESGLATDVLNFSLATASSLELVYGEFETLALVVDGVFEGTGLESIPIGPIDSIMNVINSASLTFETVGGFLEWPVETLTRTTIQDMQVTSSDVSKFVKYSKWGLTVTNFAANTVVKVVAKAKKAKQPVIKRWKGSVAAVISVPTLCVALTGDINDSVEGKEKTELIVNHFIEAFLKFGKQWGFAIASWNNEVENELMYIGLAVKQACTIGLYGFKILDFAEEQL